MNLFNIWLVARRDYLTYVMAWGFWLGILATPLLIGFFALMPILAERSEGPKYFAIVDDTGAFAESFADIREKAIINRIERAIRVSGSQDVMQSFRAGLDSGLSAEEAIAALNMPQLSFMNSLGAFVEVDAPARNGPDMSAWLRGEKTVDGPDGAKPLHAAVIYKGQGEPIEFWTESASNSSLFSMTQTIAQRHTRNLMLANAGLGADFLESVQKKTPKVKSMKLTRSTSASGPPQGREKTLADSAPMWASTGFAFFMWFIIFSVVNYLLMGTIEERSNKIFDTLLTSVRLGELLTGKLLGVLAVTFTLALVWFILGGAIFAGTSAFVTNANDTFSPLILNEVFTPRFIFVALLSFISGYVIFGSVFLALGSLCDSIHEAQTLMSPLMILMMIPLFVIVIAMSDIESSMVQYASWIPFFTPFLIILRLPTDPPLWMLLLQTGLMTAMACLVLWTTARIYRAGAVTGASIGDLWRRMTRGS